MAEDENDDVQRLIEEYPNLGRFFPFLDLLNRESPRGGVLIASSFIDDQLRRMLLAYLIDGEIARKLVDDGAYAPLSTFSARIAACYCLGLLSPDEEKSCTLIRKIRNEFAHNVDASFGDDRIRSLCSQLPDREKSESGSVIHPRRQFNTGALGVIMRLTNRAEHAAERRLKFEKWPNL